MSPTRRTIGALVLTACATLAAQQAQQPRSSASGVYTAEQASAGEKIYFDKCASCHGAELGGIERAPALTGGQFFESWQGKDLRLLRDRLDAMPPSAPKSLSDADAVALDGVPPALVGHAGQGRPRCRPIAASSPGSPSRVQRAPPATRPRPRPLLPLGRRAREPVAADDRTELRVADVWRRPRQPPLFATRPDHQRQLQQARDRVAPQDRLPRSPARHALFGHAARGRPRVYTTAGMRRAVIALNAATGEMLWMHTEDEGPRGQNAPRNGAGRGVSLLGERRRLRSPHHLRHARLPDGGAQREDRHAHPGFRPGRRRRSETRRRPGDRSRSPAKSA